MIAKTVKYKDFNGTEREEKFFFNLTKAEVTEMELSTSGGLAESIKRIVAAQDTPSIIKVFKDLILKSYGEKTLDGKRFRKVDDNGVRLAIAFSETEAYSKLFMELATDDEAAAEFVNGIMPGDLKEKNDNQLKEKNDDQLKEKNDNQ